MSHPSILYPRQLTRSPWRQSPWQPLVWTDRLREGSCQAGELSIIWTLPDFHTFHAAHPNLSFFFLSVSLLLSTFLCLFLLFLQYVGFSKAPQVFLLVFQFVYMTTEQIITFTLGCLFSLFCKCLSGNVCVKILLAYWAEIKPSPLL